MFGCDPKMHSLILKTLTGAVLSMHVCCILKLLHMTRLSPLTCIHQSHERMSPDSAVYIINEEQIMDDFETVVVLIAMMKQTLLVVL